MRCVLKSHLEKLNKSNRGEFALEDNWPLVFVKMKKNKIIPVLGK